MNNWYVGDKIVRCHCGTILHIERKRYCCKIDWLSRYPMLMANRMKQIQEAEERRILELERHREEPAIEAFEPKLIDLPIVQVEKDSCSKNNTKDKVEPKKPRKNKRKSRTMSAEMRQAVLDRDNHKCVRCGDTGKLHVHHIWHRKYGGGEDMGNLETLCLKCHIKEHENEPIANVMRKSL